MDISVTDDHKFLLLRNMNEFELESVQHYFTKEPDDAWVVKKKNPWIETKREFVNRFGMVPIGLWMELFKYARQCNVFLNFAPEIDELIQDNKLSFDIFKYYTDSLFENAYNDKGVKISPRRYQLEGIFKLLKFRKCCVEVTTSGGKTMMAYVLYKFLRDVKHTKKCLYIVPNKNLATQSFDKFKTYEKWVQGSGDYNMAYLFSGMKKAERKMLENHDLLFATFQSLNNKDKSFFEDYDVVMVDESHHASSDSIKKILHKCVNAKYVFGVTGTFPKEGSFNNFTIQSYIGPLVYTLTAFELINIEKAATPIHVVNTYLDYATDTEKKALYDARKLKDGEDVNSGSRLLKQEQNFVNNNYNRLSYICGLANKSKFNTLILFNDVNEGKGYGRKIFDYLKENSDKNVYYADGQTDAKTRDYYNEQMELDMEGQTVIVGSYGTYSEGLDISNIGVIILAQGFKSENILRQSIGRGMRLGANKDKVVMFDIIDDLRFSGDPEDKEHIKYNYMWKHHLERNKIYQKQQFPVYEQTISFKTEKLF